MGSCTLAVGRNVRDLKRALIHDHADELVLMTPVEVILRPAGHWATWQQLAGDLQSDVGLWTTAGEQVIFRGYATGLGFSKTRGSLEVSIQMIHWLSDLAFSSIFSNQSHPENPSRFNWRATYDRVSASNVASGLNVKKDFVASTRFHEFLRPNLISNDLWGRSLAEVFCAIGKDDLVGLGSPLNCGGYGAKNDLALEALARIEGDHSCANNPNKWHKKLAMDGLGTLGGLIAEAMNRYVGNQSVNAWWAHTIWDKLVYDFAPAFLFHAVPRVETAVMSPFVPGLRQTYQVSLHSEDFPSVQIKSFLRRPLRGVGVYAGKRLRTVATDRTAGEITKQIGIGGCFMPDAEARGMVMLKRPPFWLSGVGDITTRASKTALGKKGGGDRTATSSAFTPVSDNFKGDEDDKTAAERSIESGNFYDRFAQYLYVQEVLRGRQGVITGKFRYDIAPGTNIKLINFGGLHLGSDDKLAGVKVASVMRVDCAIDAEGGKAGTTIQLAHIRSEEENDEDTTSVDRHPLYDNRYAGAPLVDAYLFNT
jgi:hypothetical protein